MMRLDDGAVRLDNGARLVVLEDSKAPQVAMAVAVRAGVLEEGPVAGLSALVVRAMGRESDTRSAVLFRADAEGSGAFGVDGDRQLAVAWVVAEPDPVDVARAARLLLLDTIARPVLSAEGLALARRRLAREQAIGAVSWIDGLARRARRRALGVDAGEEPEDSGLARVTPAQLEAFHRRCFRPERAVVAVHGRVDPKSVRDLVQALLGVGGWADLAPVPPMRVPPVEPVPSGIRDTVVPGNAGLGACALCWQVPGAEAGKETMARLLLLDAVVGQGKGARLFGLRERLGIAYEVRSALEPGFRLGSWSLTAMGRRGGIEYRDRLTEVVRAIADGSAPVAAEELARARGLLLGQREVAGAMGWSRARRTAAWEALGHGECDRELPTLLAAATSPQLAETARRILAGRPGVVRTA